PNSAVIQGLLEFLRSLEGNLVGTVLLDLSAERRFESAAWLPAEFGLAVEVAIGNATNIVAVHADFTGEGDGFGNSSNELSSNLVVLGVVSSSVGVEPATTKVDLHAFGDGSANGSAEASLRVYANSVTTGSFTRQSDGEHVECALGRTQNVPVVG